MADNRDTATAESPSSDNGSLQQLMPLNERSGEMNDIRSEIQEKENQLLGLANEMDEVICNYDKETKRLKEKLYRTRDEQIESIKSKYGEVEDTFLKLRENVKSELQTFRSENFETKLSDLARYRNPKENHEDNNQEHVITRDQEKITEIRQLIPDKIPTLETSKPYLQFKDEKREIELEVAFTPYGVSYTKNGLTTTDTLPKQLTLLNTVKSGECTSVCGYQGKTFVGLRDGSVEVIEKGNDQPNKKAWRLFCCVDSVAVYKDKLYVLGSKAETVAYSRAVKVYCLINEEFIKSWPHSDSGDYLRYNKMTFVSDQLVIPDRQNKKLIVYSLTGEIQKRIDCPLLREEHVSICAVDDHSVVVSDCESFKVFRMNISSGEVEWTSEHVDYPEGIAYYRGKVLVTNPSTTTRFWILDGKTGDLLTEIPDPAVRSEASTRRHQLPVLDLHVTGDILIVPRHYPDRQVLFHRID